MNAFRSRTNLVVALVLRTLTRLRLRKGQTIDSAKYWDSRYESGGNSGPGSYDSLAEFKAEIINRFVIEHGVTSVIEHGCGDGNQLRLGNYPRYLGLDISGKALEICRGQFALDSTKSFKHTSEYLGEKAEMALSLDVIFHLVEDDVYRAYMERLFASAARYVLIYSSNSEDLSHRSAAHVKHREFTRFVSSHLPDWRLLTKIPNRYPFNGNVETSSFSDFYLFERAPATRSS